MLRLSSQIEDSSSKFIASPCVDIFLLKKLLNLIINFVIFPLDIKNLQLSFSDVVSHLVVLLDKFIVQISQFNSDTVDSSVVLISLLEKCLEKNINFVVSGRNA